jgi:hypothetical protein
LSIIFISGVSLQPHRQADIENTGNDRKAPISQTRASAPAPGWATMATPKTTETIPRSISSQPDRPDDLKDTDCDRPTTDVLSV